MELESSEFSCNIASKMIRKSPSAYHCTILVHMTIPLPFLKNLGIAQVCSDNLFSDMDFFCWSPIDLPPDLEVQVSCQHLNDCQADCMAITSAFSSQWPRWACVGAQGDGQFQMKYAYLHHIRVAGIFLWASITAVPSLEKSLWYKNFDLQGRLSEAFVDPLRVVILTHQNTGPRDEHFTLVTALGWWFSCKGVRQSVTTRRNLLTMGLLSKATMRTRQWAAIIQPFGDLSQGSIDVHAFCSRGFSHLLLHLRIRDTI